MFCTAPVCCVVDAVIPMVHVGHIFLRVETHKMPKNLTVLSAIVRSLLEIAGAKHFEPVV